MSFSIRKRILLIGLFFFGCFSLITSSTLVAQSVDFPPPKDPYLISAVYNPDGITLDGVLDPDEWANVPVHSRFIQVLPDPGQPARGVTEVKVQYDDDFLYIGAINYFPDGQTRTTVSNMNRNYAFGQNDEFGVAIDSDLDVRNASSFHCTPLGNQRDLQVLDSNFINNNWDALFYCATSVSDKYWSIEMAILLRYSDSSTEMVVQLNLYYGTE